MQRMMRESRGVPGLALVALIGFFHSARADFTPAPDGHGKDSVFFKAKEWNLGAPLKETPVVEMTPNNDGMWQAFQGGWVYWKANSISGAHVVKGAIFDLWGKNNWEKGWLGFPMTDELRVGAPKESHRFNIFDGGAIYWNADMGTAIALHRDGALSEAGNRLDNMIGDKWRETGGEGGVLLGKVVSGELRAPSPNANDRYRWFTSGFVYWHANTKTAVVCSLYNKHWKPEDDAPASTASSPYGSSPTGFNAVDTINAAKVVDAKAAQWNLGKGKGLNGMANKRGLFEVYNSAAIYWTPKYGAVVVMGTIGAKWADQKWESGPLGFPITDQKAVREAHPVTVRAPHENDRYNIFENGAIYWHADTNTALNLPCLRFGKADANNRHEETVNRLYASTGGENGRLGKIITPVMPAPAPYDKDAYRFFENGAIYLHSDGNAPVMLLNGT